MMTRERKTVSVSFRASTKFKRLLETAAALERKSQANLLETLLFTYCDQKALTSTDGPPSADKNTKR